MEARVAAMTENHLARVFSAIIRASIRELLTATWPVSMRHSRTCDALRNHIQA
jgi:hypothetical protein